MCTKSPDGIFTMVCNSEEFALIGAALDEVISIMVTPPILPSDLEMLPIARRCVAEMRAKL